MQHCLPN